MESPFSPTHPGTLIKEELRERKIKQKEFSKKIGVLPSFLNEILNGKRPVSTDFALKLENELGISAEFWLRFQMQYDLDKARKKETVRT